MNDAGTSWATERTLICPKSVDIVGDDAPNLDFVNPERLHSLSLHYSGSFMTTTRHLSLHRILGQAKVIGHFGFDCLPLQEEQYAELVRCIGLQKVDCPTIEDLMIHIDCIRDIHALVQTPNVKRLSLITEGSFDLSLPHTHAITLDSYIMDMHALEAITVRNANLSFEGIAGDADLGSCIMGCRKLVAIMLPLSNFRSIDPVAFSLESSPSLRCVVLYRTLNPDGANGLTPDIQSTEKMIRAALDASTQLTIVDLGNAWLKDLDYISIRSKYQRRILCSNMKPIRMDGFSADDVVDILKGGEFLKHVFKINDDVEINTLGAVSEVSEPA